MTMNTSLLVVCRAVDCYVECLLLVSIWSPRSSIEIEYNFFVLSSRGRFSVLVPTVPRKDWQAYRVHRMGTMESCCTIHSLAYASGFSALWRNANPWTTLNCVSIIQTEHPTMHIVLEFQVSSKWCKTSSPLGVRL